MFFLFASEYFSSSHKENNRAGFYIKYKKNTYNQINSKNVSPQIPIEKMLGILTTYDSYSFANIGINTLLSNRTFYTFSPQLKKHLAVPTRHFINLVKDENSSVRLKKELFYNLSANIEYQGPSYKKTKQQPIIEKQKTLDEQFFRDHKVFLGIEYNLHAPS